MHSHDKTKHCVKKEIKGYRKSQNARGKVGHSEPRCHDARPLNAKTPKVHLHAYAITNTGIEQGFRYDKSESFVNYGRSRQDDSRRLDDHLIGLDDELQASSINNHPLLQ
jgi:hypothetical protein